MASKTKERRKRTARIPGPADGNSTKGHPSLEELQAEQGTGPITDVRVLRGDFWPEDEPIEDFLEALHEWRGHRRN